MPDQKTRELKASYDQIVTKVARNVYLKMHETIRDLNESNISDEDKNSIRLHLINMVLPIAKLNKS